MKEQKSKDIMRTILVMFLMVVLVFTHISKAMNLEPMSIIIIALSGVALYGLVGDLIDILRDEGE